MAEFQRFTYRSIDALKADISRLGLNIPVTDDLSPLAAPVKIGTRTAANAFAVLPMEGFDCSRDGVPSDLTHRRYMRYGAGGAGLIWFEACAVVPEGKSNPCQMILTEENLGAYKALVSDLNNVAEESVGFKPLNILQISHSGRYSRPNDLAKKEPVIVKHDPEFDARVGIDETYPVQTDEELEALIPAFVRAAVLAKEAGFDGVDVKTCHRYLFSELMSCYNRPGKFGGSLENRAALPIAIIKEIRRVCGDDFIIVSRFSVFDFHPYPVGFGASPDKGFPIADEAIELVKMLVAAGADLLSASGGDVYKVPYVTRPFNQGVIGGTTPPEHPLEGVARHMDFAREMKKAAGDVPFIGTCYTWLREYLPNVGAAVIAEGGIDMIGFGRGAFAYPDMPKDVFTAKIDPKKVCTACSKCTQIMRDGGKIGCPVRDADIYVPIYREYRAKMEAQAGK